MKFDGLELSNIFDPFYDRNEEYDRLCKRLAHEQEPGDGTYQSIVFRIGLSAEDQEIVDWHDRNEERHLQAMMSSPKETPPSQGSLIPYCPDIGLMQLALLRATTTQTGKNPNTYQLLKKVLSICDLRKYNGKFYLGCIPDSRRAAGQIIFQDAGHVFVPLAADRLKALIFQILEGDIAACGTTNPLRQVSELLDSYPYIQMEHTTDDVHHVYFRNGCLDALTGHFRPNTLEDFFTAYLNFDFPTDSVPPTPYTDAFLSTASCGNPAWIEAVLELLGLIMVSDMSAKHFYLLQGVKNSGKSVLGNLISKLFNQEAVAHIDIFRFKDRFSPSGLENCRVNVSMDLIDKSLSKEAVAMIKMITGGDGVTLEQKFKDAKAATIRCIQVFATNFALMLGKLDPAFSERLYPIPFLYSVPKEQQDPMLREKLQQELPGIAVKAIAAYNRLRQRNYRFPDLGIPSFSGVCGYVPIAELLRDFVSDFCDFDDPKAFTPTRTLLAGFNQFCESRGVPGIQDTVQFSRQLNKFCAGRIRNDKQRVNGDSANGYWGIKLKNPDI